ncbi:hypothetical protein [Priestia koreensis]|uniref:hypothetical protein n=1 Tax=Priestia koreensis TaxID=284581 RepID=UPI001F590C32|nr:hypothetical protein [Priestia koreensis]UNL85725.1 hypothetical protein IE339_04215 [Priestia koreensis]
MKDFLNSLINYPFKQLEKKVKQETGEEIYIPEIHAERFTIIPEVIRRCHFLTSTEKDVLYELIAWASTTKNKQDGTCKVTESHIRVNTNLGLSTVKKSIQSLHKKGFISKALDYDKSNIYRIKGVDKNPYVILSEWLFYIRDQRIQSFSNMMLENEQYNYALSKKIFVEATMNIIKNEDVYMKYIEKITVLLDTLYNPNLECNYRHEIDSIFNDLNIEAHQLYLESANKLQDKFEN